MTLKKVKISNLMAVILLLKHGEPLAQVKVRFPKPVVINLIDYSYFSKSKL